MYTHTHTHTHPLYSKTKLPILYSLDEAVNVPGLEKRKWIESVARYSGEKFYHPHKVQILNHSPRHM